MEKMFQRIQRLFNCKWKSLSTCFRLETVQQCAQWRGSRTVSLLSLIICSSSSCVDPHNIPYSTRHLRHGPGDMGQSTWLVQPSTITQSSSRPSVPSSINVSFRSVVSVRTISFNRRDRLIKEWWTDSEVGLSILSWRRNLDSIARITQYISSLVCRSFNRWHRLIQCQWKNFRC